VVSLATIPLAAQQEPSGKAAPPAARKPVDPARRVPNFFDDVGLTGEQRETIYKIRAKHQARLDELKKQIAETNAQILEECEGVLTAPQKEVLAARRRAAAESARAKLAAKKQAAKKKDAPARKDDQGSSG
jgi:hypothetical protein